MKNILQKIKNNKLLSVLTLTVIISFILGILYPAIISENNKELVKESLNHFFISISKEKLNYIDAMIATISNNTIICILIWLLGISLIGLPIIIFTLIAKSFIVGFSISSIISVYKIKGIIYAIIYIIPLIINLLVSYILCYYSIRFSIMLFNYLFRKKEYNRKSIVKRYIKILIFCFIIFVFSSFFEVFIIPNILKYMI